MTDPRETHFTGAEGECENSQAEGSDRDGTSERTAAHAGHQRGNGRDPLGIRSGISQVMTEAEDPPPASFSITGQNPQGGTSRREKTKEGIET